MSNTNIEKEPRVENLMQKLEEACSRAEASGCGQQRDQLLHGSAYVPTRIRDIADQCLSPSRQYRGGAGDQSHQTSPSHNSSALQSELKRAQDMLDQSRKDCRSLSTKYLAVSDKLKLITTLEEKIADLILENRKLVEERTAVHCKMAEQEERHALHLRAYQDGQEKHSKLVLKLQNKVLQYKDACSDLQVKLQDEHDVFKRETSGLQETINRLKEEVSELKEQLHKTKEADGATLKSAVNEADSQEKRANQLFTSNSKLRQQLEEMNKMNQRLSEDVHQLTVGWNEAQSQLKEKDEVWHKILTEECERTTQSQKACLKKALEDASEVKEDFRRLKFTTLRDLGLLNGEFSVVSEQLIMRVERYCGANSTMKASMNRGLQQRDRDYAKVVTELNSLKCEHEAVKTQRLMEVEGREKRIRELTLSLQTAEQAKLEQVKCVNDLMSKLADMEVSQQTLTHGLTSAKNTSSTLKEDCETLKSALDEIVQLFITPGDTPLTVASRCSSPRRMPLSTSPPCTLSTPPTRCDCHGDSTRLKDWSISMVKHGIDASEKEMKCLENELSSMAQVLKDKQERIKLLEEEIKSHSSTTSVMKSDLGICHANLQELNKVKFRLEHQLEEMNMQKQQVERRLTQTTARLDSILDEKTKKEASNASLEEAITGLREQLKKMDQEKESLESKLASKDNESHHLELQLRTSEEEVKKIRVRMTELELHKMEVERELNSTRASVSKLELEKEDLQKELRKVKDSEYSIMATLSELRMANTKLEADKRLLTQSLQETASINARLDEENAKLEQVRFASEEKIQELVSTSRQLSGQIAQLDKSLQESEASKSELQMERDKLCQELASLTDSLNKAKETIAELQVQKGKLTNSITKLAREKGDLVQEKAELEKERAQLQESLHLAEERVRTSRAAKERLEQRIEDLDKALAVAEQTAFKLQETNFALQQEKHDMKLEQERLEQAKDQAISQLQNDKALELQQVLVQARGQESDLQAAIVRLEASCDRRLAELEELHVQKVALLNSEHSRMVTQLQEAMASLKETNKDEMARATFQKEQHVSRMEKERKLLQEQVNQLQELYADTCEKSREQQTLATDTISGLKLQIQTSQNTITTLEKELSMAEHQMHTLQAKLEDINCGTNEQIEALRSQLKTASDTITALEQTQDRLLIDTKQLESKREALKGQLDEVYKQLHLTSEEREALRGDCQGLKQDVCTLKEELAGSKMAVTNLVENLSKTDDSRFLAEKDAKAYYKSLLSLEQAHARLTADHANLQAALTSCERRATSLQLELKESKQKGESLEGNNEQLNKKVSSLEEHLRAATKACRQLEHEGEEGRLRMRAVEAERDEHKAAVIRVRDAANAEAGHQAAESLKLAGELEAAKVGCSRLRDEVAELEFELETSRRGCSDLESRLTATEGLVRRYKDEQADLMVACKELHERHSELMSVLNGTLGLKLEHPLPKSTGVKKGFPGSDPAAGRSADATGYLSESGIECSLDTTQGSQVGGAGTPSGYCTLVRDAILTLHKQVLEARNEKYDVASSSQLTSKRLKALEEEKALLETQLKSAQAACASLGASMEGLKKKQAESEVMCVQHTEDIQVLDRKCRQLQIESDALKTKLSGERMAKEASDAKLRQLVQAKSDCDLEKDELVNQLSEARIARQRFQEQSDKLAMELSVLKSQNAAKEAELIQLMAKHDDVKQRLSETEQQLVLAKESALVLDRSLSEITRKEAELVNKTHQLELQLGRLRVDRLQLEERVMQHEEDSSRARRDKDTLELQLQQLTQSEGHTRKKAEALEHSISDGELKKSKMASKLQQLETQLQEEHVGKIKAESSFNETQMEKKALEARLKSLEATLESATKSNVASQQLCSSLERETQHLRGEVQRLRDENGRLKTELKTVQFQLQKVDTESLPEQQKASKLSQRVLSVTQQNTELLQTVRSLKSALETKDEEYKQRLDSMVKETEKLRGAYKTTEAQWEGKEKDYKASIGQFERKVQLLEDKIDRARQKRTEYMERVREHEGSIPGMRPHQDQPPVPHSPAEGGAKYVAPVRLSEEAMRLKQSTMELLQSAAPFFTPTRPSVTPLTSTPIKKT